MGPLLGAAAGHGGVQCHRWRGVGSRTGEARSRIRLPDRAIRSSMAYPFVTSARRDQVARGWPVQAGPWAQDPTQDPLHKQAHSAGTQVAWSGSVPRVAQQSPSVAVAAQAITADLDSQTVTHL